MLVIGDPELRFRVNVRPTAATSLRRTTGSFTICQPYRRRGPAGMRACRQYSNFAGWNSEPSSTVPAAWLTGYFHACPAAAAL